MMRVASCSADIPSEKKPTIPPLTVLTVPSGCFSPTYARSAGDNDKVRRLQATHLAIEIGQAGRDAGELAVALVSRGGHVDSGRERVRKALEAAVVAAGLGEFVEPPLRLFDLVARRGLDGRVVSHVDHVLADADQVPANGE